MSEQEVKPYMVGWVIKLGSVPKIKSFDNREKALKFWRRKRAWAGITIKNVWIAKN